ncbi:hypothetical protein [Krasilnikovia cinnamomea]|uniref:hypothetical protein n=1 Tax=Krasilnikovia cinnamomea TaxID=349313 RepID=UPI001F5F01F1|nr:hypothetical protein [Krasilnikovia cinnamomea]
MTSEAAGLQIRAGPIHCIHHRQWKVGGVFAVLRIRASRPAPSLAGTAAEDIHYHRCLAGAMNAAARELTSKDLRRVLEFARATGEDDTTEPTSHLLERIVPIVGSDLAWCAHVDIPQRSVSSVGPPGHPRVSLREGFAEAFREHPGFVAVQQGRLQPGTPMAVSDLIDRRGLRRLRLYVDHHRPFGIEDQLCQVVSCRPQVDGAHLDEDPTTGGLAGDQPRSSRVLPPGPRGRGTARRLPAPGDAPTCPAAKRRRDAPAGDPGEPGRPGMGRAHRSGTAGRRATRYGRQ